MLQFDTPVTLSYEEFLNIVSPFVSSRDKEYLNFIKDDASLLQDISHPFFISYNKFLKILNRELRQVRLSAHKELSVDEDEKMLLHDSLIYETVKKAVGQENPLEAEISLLRLLYNEVEYLKEGHYFDSVSLFAYALQLRMLERKSRFIPIEGNTEFKRLFTNLQSIIKSI